MRLIFRTLFFALFLQFTNCSDKPDKTENSTPPVTPSLKTTYSKDFTIGAAINEAIILQKDTLALKVLKRDFSSITPENIMKWEEIHPVADTFNFDLSDKFVALGEENEMEIIGHTLVWHSQIGPWMNTLTDSTIMAKYIKEHINTVAGRYKGKIHGWDVVNEALNEDGSLRESVFLKVMGDGYLPLAFKQAAEADPEAELYYNDYNMWKPEKREGAVRLVKLVQESGARISGVGMQGHWGLEEPDLAEVEKSILAYAALGVKVMITELDITVLPNPWDMEGAEVSQNFREFEGDEKMNPYASGLPDSVQLKLANRYTDIFKLFLKHKDKISRVTFWGVGDANSWLNGWPIRGRTNYPLLFDREYNRKNIYDSVIGLKTQPNQKLAL
ncbi:hypothetical protein LCGC14_1063590 [marine sediment metagenome]|uniref:Beta-xylanase n=2 Tax=root TaxID=1 RepID=A0A831QRC6_9FLAO|nr:endo-1,4-beta-xylanase [Pricia antarctica]